MSERRSSCSGSSDFFSDSLKVIPPNKNGRPAKTIGVMLSEEVAKRYDLDPGIMYWISNEGKKLIIEGRGNGDAMVISIFAPFPDLGLTKSQKEDLCLEE